MKPIKFTPEEVEVLKYFLKDGYNKPEIQSVMKKIARAEKRITVQSAKGKGRNLQKWVCSKVSFLTGVPYFRGDDSLIRSREMGQAGADVILRGIARERFPYTIECKNSESFNLASTVEQVQANLIDKTDWLIVYKRKSFKNPVVIIDWDAFEKLQRTFITFTEK